MRLTRTQLETMIAHCRAGAPAEACGLLDGTDDTVNDVYCLENAHHSPVSYELTAEGYQVLIRLDDEGRLLGAFHSHTHSPAYPSATDRRLAMWPIYYVLISLADETHPVTRVFRIIKRDALDPQELGLVTEEDMEIV